MAAARKTSNDALLLALACGGTVENAARKVGLTERSVYRRMADPAFREQVTRTRAEIVQRTAATMAAAGMEAVKTLVELMHTDQPASVRLGAARSVLELGLKLRESGEFEERLARLEQELGQRPRAYSSADAA
jgi:hypothetical protein